MPRVPSAMHGGSDLVAIYGIYGPRDDAEPERMQARLRHRGSGGAHWSPERDVCLGRLHGTRQVHAEETGGGIAFAGCLDDGDALAARLGADVEDLLLRPAAALEALYAREGTQAFAAFDGAFALALWDARSRELVLARDRFGAQPLYYARAGERWAFASEYKALLALEDLPAHPDPDAIAHLHGSKNKPPNSLLKGVFSVPCGGGVVLGAQGERRFRYWSPRIEVARRTQGEHLAAVRDALLRAMARQCRAHARLGVALSGGLDSAIVLAALRQVAPERELHAFTGGWGDGDPEIARAGEAARAFGAVHHPVVLRPSELPAILPRVIWHIEDPVGREDNPYLYVTAREAARHVDVLFAGYGADLLFGGMPRHKLVNAAFGLPAPLRAPLQDLLGYAQHGRAPATALGRLLVAAWYRGTDFPPPRVAGAQPLPPLPPLAPPPGGSPLSSYLASSLDSYPGKPQVECLHAAFGLRFNAPFVAPEFMDTAFTLPDALKIRWFVREKYALREACAGWMPESLRKRPKSLQRLRHDRELCDVLDQLAASLLTPERVRARGLFEPEYVERARRRPAGGIYPSEQLYRVWSLVATELWAQLFVDARGAALAA